MELYNYVCFEVFSSFLLGVVDAGWPTLTPWTLSV